MDSDFSEAADQLIANRRSAPMLDEIQKEVEQAKARRLAHREPCGGFGDILRRAQEQNQAADPIFVAECMSLFRRRYDPRVPPNNRLSPQQWEEGLNYLGQVAREISGGGGK